MNKNALKPTTKGDKTMLEILQANGFSKICAQDLVNLQFEWLIEGFLAKQSLVMLYAQAGSGKSYFALYLSKFLLENDKVKQVLYLDADNGKRTLKERQIDKFIQMPNFTYYAENNQNKYTIFRYLQKASDLENILIVIDSVRNFIKDDFNKDNMMIKFFDELQILRDNGATIIFLHHQPKQIQDENNKLYKGATTFLDSIDEGYFLHKIDIKEYEEFVILVEPQKRRDATNPHAFKINTLNLMFESVDYLKYGENHKTQITLNLVKDILSECDELCQQDLASKIKRKVEQDYVEIVGRNALWKLLDKYKGILWDIIYQPQEKGGKKKCFKLIQN